MFSFFFKQAETENENKLLGGQTVLTTYLVLLTAAGLIATALACSETQESSIRSQQAIINKVADLKFGDTTNSGFAIMCLTAAEELRLERYDERFLETLMDSAQRTTICQMDDHA